MSTIPTVAVSVILYGQDGSPIQGVEIEAKLETLEKFNGFVVPELVEAVAGADGVAVLNLFPNELGSESSEYRFRISYPSGRTDTVYAVVPNVDCELHNITELDHFEYRSIGAVITKQIADNVEAAQETKAIAEQSAATSVAARDETLQAKADVLAAQEAVETDKATIADLKTQTEVTRDTSVAAASEAVGVRDTLVAARDEAVGAANASVNAASTAIAESEAAGTAKTAAETAQVAAEAAATQAGQDKDSVAADKVTVVNAKDEAVAAKQDLDTAVYTVTTAKDATVTAKTEAEAAVATAVGAKNEAVAAKQNVDTAVTTATAAKGAAVIAKTGAESAATTAVGAKDTAVAEAVTATTEAAEATKQAGIAATKAEECAQVKADVLTAQEAMAGLVANPNILINGCFDVWQAGESYPLAASTGHRIADMWLVHTAAGCTGTADLWTIGRKSLKSLIGFSPQYGIRVNITGGGCGLEQRIELRNIGYEDEYFFSFLSSSPNHTWAFGYWDADGITGHGGVGGDTVVEKIGEAEGLYLHTAVVCPPSFDITSASLDFAFIQVASIGDKGDVFFTGFKLERGGVRTPYPPEELGEVFHKCQRYYEMLGAVNISLWNTADKWCHVNVSYVSKRTTPVASWTYSDNNMEAINFYNTSPMLNKGYFNSRSSGTYGVAVYGVVLDARL